MQQPKKILIIYENTGSGHKKAAEMLAEYLNDPMVTIELTTSSELINQKDNIFVNGWNFLVKKNCLKLADFFLNFISRIFLLPFFYILTPKALKRGVDRFNPDIIISTADVNRLIGSYAKSKGIPFYIFITSGAIFVDMLHAHAHHLVYLKETAKIINSVRLSGYFSRDVIDKTSLAAKIFDACCLLTRYSLGYPQSPYFTRYRSSLPRRNQLQVSVLGPVREKKFYQPGCRTSIVTRYQLPSDGQFILISNGRFGGEIIKKIIQKIIDNHHLFNGMLLNLIAVCGQDAHLVESIQTSDLPPGIRLITLSNQASLAELYQLADCSIGRGTAGILMDCLLSQTPPIVLKQITSNDFGTLDIIHKYRLGAIAEDLKAIPLHLKEILTHKDHYMNAIIRLNKEYTNFTPNDIEASLKTHILETCSL